MTIRCTECGGAGFLGTPLKGDPQGQQILEYICASDGCDGSGRIVYDHTIDPDGDESRRQLEGDIEEAET